MAIVGEPCNVDAHANIPIVPMLCVDMYCTVHTNCDCTVVLLTNQSIATIQGTPHTQTESNVELGFTD